ncbi:hypothetical protein GALMADRAFT_791595 [Galerina marginata CBS 339.88]|uniref:Uncharacterized protein n=1 Tax=Galerina marginata (strain CBS 339.88) TaxID=685588 RepID=A0A067SV60_GALM3|nr:hypothetical protein GALMADRAFT_791595 [Galerina marginata CBS 339.88]
MAIEPYSKSSSKKNQPTSITPLPCIPTQLGQLHLNDHSLLHGLPACTPTAPTKQTTNQVHGKTASTTQHTTNQVHGKTTPTKGSEATTVSKITTHPSSSKSKEPEVKSSDVPKAISMTNIPNSSPPPVPTPVTETPSPTSLKSATSASSTGLLTEFLSFSPPAVTNRPLSSSLSTKIATGTEYKMNSKSITSTRPSHTTSSTSGSPYVPPWPKVFIFGTETVHPRSTGGLSIALAILVYLLGVILVVFLLRLRAHRARNGGNGHKYGVIS